MSAMIVSPSFLLEGSAQQKYMRREICSMNAHPNRYHSSEC